MFGLKVWMDSNLAFADYCSDPGTENLGELFAHCRAYSYALARSLGYDREAAEDAVTAWAKLDSYIPALASLRCWWRSVAYNNLSNAARTWCRKSTIHCKLEGHS